MIHDDLNRINPNRDTLNRDPLTPNDRYEGTSSGWIWAIAAVAVFAILFMWSPWSGPPVADNTAPGTTVGSSTRPARAPGADDTGTWPKSGSSAMTRCG